MPLFVFSEYYMQCIRSLDYVLLSFDTYMYILAELYMTLTLAASFASALNEHYVYQSSRYLLRSSLVCAYLLRFVRFNTWPVVDSYRWLHISCYVPYSHYSKNSVGFTECTGTSAAHEARVI